MKKISDIFKSYTTQILTISFVVIGFIIFIGALEVRKIVKNTIKQHIYLEQNKELTDYSTSIENKLSSNTAIIKQLSLFFSDYSSIPERKRRIIFDQNLHKVISNNKDIYAIWCVFKPYSIDTYDKDYSVEDKNLTGQFTETYIKNKENISLKEISISDYNKLEKYLPKFRSANNILYILPLEDPYKNTKIQSYIARLVAPVFSNGKIVGIIGIDIKYDNLFNYNFNNNLVYVLADNSNIIFSNQKQYINKKIDDVYLFLKNNNTFIKKFALEKNFSSYDYLFSPNEKMFYTITFKKLPLSNKKWAILFTENNNIYIKTVRKKDLLTFFIPLIVIFFLFILISRILKHINKFLYEIKTNTYNVCREDKNIEFRKRRNTEMFSIQEAFLKLRKNIEKYRTYLNYLYSEDYDKEFSFNEKDILKNSFIKLKEKYKSEKKRQTEFAENQKKEAEISKAVAEINNIQREYLKNIEELGYQTVKFIADFINAVQAGLYIVISDNKQKKLRLISFYSYNRRVYHNKEIDFGDGLAGTCALEKKSIYTKVPDNYLEITSGLGKKAPNYIFLLPLIHNEELFGILEFAFLEKLDNRFISFLSTISTIVAASIATSETNQRTEKLLAETQKITEEMERKEAEMNEQIKNLNELRIKSKIQELNHEAIQNAINEIVFFAEFDTKANVLSINNNLSDKLEILVSDATLLTYYDIFLIREKYIHENYWKKVLEGKKANFELFVSFGRNKMWFQALLAPVYNIDGEIYKVIFLGIDITQLKIREEELNKVMMELNEKAEQINIQENEMNDFFAEYEQMTKEIARTKQKIEIIEQEKEKLQNSIEFLQKEFQKRFARNKKIERNLKNQIRKLNDELNKCKGQNNSDGISKE